MQHYQLLAEIPTHHTLNGLNVFGLPVTKRPDGSFYASSLHEERGEALEEMAAIYHHITNTREVVGEIDTTGKFPYIRIDGVTLSLTDV